MKKSIFLALLSPLLLSFLFFSGPSFGEPQKDALDSKRSEEQVLSERFMALQVSPEIKRICKSPKGEVATLCKAYEEAFVLIEHEQKRKQNRLLERTKGGIIQSLQ